MAQGLDPEPVTTTVAPPKSVGHGKIMPPNTRDQSIIRIFLLHMCEKVGARLRKHDLQAQHFFFGLRIKTGWLALKPRLMQPTANSRRIYQLGEQTLNAIWHGEGVHQIQVTALDPRPDDQQDDLFIPHDARSESFFSAVDAVNNRYGEFSLAPARLLLKSDMPNVISPAWKPDGHRQTI